LINEVLGCLEKRQEEMKQQQNTNALREVCTLRVS
jgi:hypothetical protein